MLGKTIKSLLAANSGLVALVGAKITPYVLAPSTTLPAVIYTVDSIDPEYDKGFWTLDNAEFSVHSFSKDYDQLVSVATAVRTALESKSTGSGTQSINKIYVTGQNEGFQYADEGGGFYFNELSFKVRVNKY